MTMPGGRGAGATPLRVLSERDQRELQLLSDRAGLVGDLQALVEHGHRVLRVAGEE